mmetsp:Transcript_35339/g.100036  ORF Transcript_35339/g.100036 Transcript_35339/m.100036 type:complete len:517 (+) Transcript_35339:217-1767(+)|eukprot:CAMPEP_0117672964 /NCGR_PEP_ID=MMETSP0804-20121206/14208_1 /TAXON_ID=1074897 /ORGANISM="Tetraselmis astigmatica, Strain CCMP880" /LENGTH=516 /DNA_ID=CAMNT_0005481647 /DNA_START=357 /DNA_END=1907 /DNA_ORIENTATION=-
MPPYQGSISESSGAMPPPAVSDGPVLEGGSPLRDPAASSLPCFDSRPLKAVAVGPWQATPVVSGISHPDTPRPTSAEEGVAALAPSSGNSVSVGSTITEHYAVGLPILEVSGNLSSEEREARVNSIIQEYKAKLQFRTQHHMGYPYNLDFDYGPLEDLSKFSINNLGDPFIESNYGVHSREFEVGVLEWFAKLWDIDQEGYWGYITNCGTEGNLHGILVGRENFPDGILYTSKETHYSVPKAARMYRMDLVEVSTLPSGEINYEELEEELRQHSDRPAIINVNIGTTVKGAVDDLDKVLEILERTGYSEDRFYIHCDGALFGLMIPFVTSAPMVSFKKPIGSISVSGHKFIGSPVPCGVVMTRQSHIMALSSNVEYLNSRDATIMGSRNGHAPIYLWYMLSKKGYDGMRKDVEKCLRNAHVLKSMLESAGIRVMLNRLSSTVVFERPEDLAFVRKWQLACEGEVAHVVVMPNIGIDKLQVFVAELIASRAAVAAGKAKLVAESALADEMKRASLGT